MENLGEKYYLKFEITNQLTGEKGSDIIETSKEKIQELNELSSKHIREFDKIFNNLCPQFDKKIAEIGRKLSNLYEIDPSKDGFIDWFTRIKIGNYKITPYFENGIMIDLEFFFPDYESIFIPNIQDQFLHEYCIYVSNEQDQIKNNLSATNQPKGKKTKTLEINPRTSEAKLNYLEIVTWYINLRKESKTPNTAKNNTMLKFKIKIDTFRKAFKENKQILIGTEYEADFKFLKPIVK